MSESPNHFGPFQTPLPKLQHINHTRAEPSVFDPSATSRIGNAIILTASLVFGVLFNSFTVHLLRKGSVLNKTTTTVLLHLAASDLTACFVVMPMEFVLFVSVIHPNQVFSTMYYVFTNFTVLVDCGCHVLLSIDRCCTVKQTQSIGIPVIYFKKVLLAVWGVGFGNAILTASTNQRRLPWLFERNKPLDPGTIVLFIFIWVALAALVIALVYVQYTVKKQDEDAGEQFGNASSKKRRQKQIKVLKSTVVAMTCAILSYLPFMLCEYVHRVFKTQSPSITSFSQILTSVSHAINLLIYTGMSKKFRKAAWKELKLYIRRDNIRSSLINERPKKARADPNRQTFSSCIADSINSSNAKEREEKRSVISNGSKEREAELSDEESYKSDYDLPFRERGNTESSCDIQIVSTL